MTEQQHDAHCYIMQETWPKPAKGKKRAQVMVPRKIECVDHTLIYLRTQSFVKHALYRHEFAKGHFRIIRV